jgi:hypothetical protein
MAGKGHEDQFRPPSLSGGCRLGKATFAGTGGKEEDAPIPAAPRRRVKAAANGACCTGIDDTGVWTARGNRVVV